MAAGDRSFGCGGILAVLSIQLALGVGQGFTQTGDHVAFMAGDLFFHKRWAGLMASAQVRTAFLPAAERLAALFLVKRVSR
jgi:hypothetical protein